MLPSSTTASSSHTLRSSRCDGTAHEELEQRRTTEKESRNLRELREAFGVEYQGSAAADTKVDNVATGSLDNASVLDEFVRMRRSMPESSRELNGARLELFSFAHAQRRKVCEQMGLYAWRLLTWQQRLDAVRGAQGRSLCLEPRSDVNFDMDVDEQQDVEVQHVEMPGLDERISVLYVHVWQTFTSSLIRLAWLHLLTRERKHQEWRAVNEGVGITDWNAAIAVAREVKSEVNALVRKRVVPAPSPSTSRARAAEHRRVFEANAYAAFAGDPTAAFVEGGFVEFADAQQRRTRQAKADAARAIASSADNAMDVEACGHADEPNYGIGNIIIFNVNDEYISGVITDIELHLGEYYQFASPRHKDNMDMRGAILLQSEEVDGRLKLRDEPPNGDRRWRSIGIAHSEPPQYVVSVSDNVDDDDDNEQNVLLVTSEAIVENVDIDDVDDDADVVTYEARDERSSDDEFEYERWSVPQARVALSPLCMLAMRAVASAARARRSAPLVNACHVQ